jgi:hypothetical protein
MLLLAHVRFPSVSLGETKPCSVANSSRSLRVRLPSRELLCLAGRHLFGQSVLQRRAQGVCTATMARSSNVEGSFTVFAVSDLASAGSCRPSTFVPSSHSAMSISSPLSARYNVSHCTRNVSGLSSSEVHSLGCRYISPVNLLALRHICLDGCEHRFAATPLK